MTLGKFIVFEGGEGTGKTTQIKMLSDYLQSKQQKVFLTREPGGTDCPIAEKIRELIKDPQNKDMAPKCELFLFLASRAQHVEQIIQPHLQQGDIVICDRFFGSTLAYQHYGRGLFELEEVKKINDFATDKLIPDLTLLLDIDPRQGLARISERINDDRLDSEKLEFHQQVRDGYLNLAQSEPNWVTINAGQSIEQIHKEILQPVNNLLSI